MNDYRNKSNNEEDEYEEEFEYGESDLEEDKENQYKKSNKNKKEKRSYNINNNKKQKTIDTNTNNEDKKQYNYRYIKETKPNYYINENRKNSRAKINQYNSDKLSKNSFENSSQYRAVRKEKRDNQINYLNESDNNLNKSVRMKLLGLKYNINKKKDKRIEKDLEQLKALKEIYLNEIMNLRNELDITNQKLLKESKEKNNLLKLIDDISNKLHSYDLKPYIGKNKVRNKSEGGLIEEDLIKLIESKEQEYQSLIKENVILKNDIKKLKSEIKQYNNVEKVELLNQSKEKDREINNLKKLNEEQKRLLDNVKYEQLMEHINNEMDKKEGILNDLNSKLTSLSLRIKEKENQLNKSINLKFNNINNYSTQKNKRNIFHSFCKCSLKSGLKNNKSEIFRPRRNNFYNLFNEKERNAINTLFESTEELNNFKAKIENIEKRNDHYERMLKNENNELIKINNEKDEIIKGLNIKEKEHLKRINDCKIQLWTNRNLNNKLEKMIKTKDETENVYRELLKRKDEEIQNLIQAKIISSEKIKDNRKEKMLKKKEEDIQSFKDELGVINVIDIDKILKPKKNKFSSSLLVQKNNDIYYKGLSNMDRMMETKDENEEKKEENDVKEDKENN